MRKNFNVIQINGFRGILYLVFIGICLAAGFGWFPGWTCMKLWNLLAVYFVQIPTIGIFQGILLWGIIAASYFTFRKNKLVVCMKASEGLSEEELKAIFSDMKKTVQDDSFIKTMMKAQDAELRIRNLSESNIPGINISEVKNLSQKTNNKEQTDKVHTK